MTTLDRESIDAPLRTAVLDSAHVGDVEGALGRIRLSDNVRPRTLKTRLATPLAIVGPGLIVTVGDNDAGGVATYPTRRYLGVVTHQSRATSSTLDSYRSSEGRRAASCKH